MECTYVCCYDNHGNCDMNVEIATWNYGNCDMKPPDRR
jgi:hypothetical protein